METITEKQHAHELIERLEDSQVLAAVRFLEFILIDPVYRSIMTAPPDEETFTAEEVQSVKRAEAWFEERGGRGIPHGEVLAEFGLTTNDFPLKKNGV